MTPSLQIPEAGGPVQAWFLDPRAPLPGAFSTLNISEWPNAADVSLCSLFEALETGALPPRYFLSAKACAGILHRAEKRRKVLPEPLTRALRAVVALGAIPECSSPEV